MTIFRHPDETRLERQTREAQEHSAEHFAARARPVTLPPGPGKSDAEIARLEEQRQAAQNAAAATKAAQVEQAAEARKLALDQAQALRTFKVKVDNDLGRAKFDLRQAVERCDFEAAIEVAGRVAALEVVGESLKQVGKAFSAAHRGPMYFLVGAERI